MVVAQALLVSLVFVSLSQSSASPSSDPLATPTPTPTGKAHPREDFAGRWKYNADESINAATGRSETARAVNDRRGVRGGGAPRGGPGGPSMGGGGYRGSGPPAGGGYGAGTDIGMAIYLEQRDTQRDLMEIAPELQLAVTPSSVTIKDDLNRELTFSTDGKKQKHQLGAAIFDAKTTWDAGQLKNNIEGPDGLKVTATYFLSEDGDRLFLILRIGEPVKDQPPVGVNRVYDRVK
jgi:hypothetical protein